MFKFSYSMIFLVEKFHGVYLTKFTKLFHAELRPSSHFPRQCHGIPRYVFQYMQKYSVCDVLFQVFPDYAMDCHVIYMVIQVTLHGNPWNLDLRG